MPAARYFLMVVTCLFLLTGLGSCWSARCPRTTCRVRVEHRHGDLYYRPREAWSWMWTPRYKHVRNPNTPVYAQNKAKIWRRIFKPGTPVTQKKAR
jgi:hypothetical protein